MPIQKRAYDERIFTLFPLLSEPECEAMIERARAIGFDEAPITTERGFVMAKDIRDNTRAMFDDAEFAAAMFARVREFLPERSDGQALPVGLNERLRVYRYEEGQAFRWHRDGAFVRDGRERSRLTFMVYLNGGFEGGATEFDSEPPLAIQPRAGLALAFDHPLMHQGAPIVRGVKYALRTDVMYRRSD